MTDKETVNEEVGNDNPPFEYAFVVKKGNDGNLSISSFQDGTKVSTEQIYSACSTICKNIDAQEIASTVAQTLVSAAAQYGRSEAGLVLPGDIKGSSNGR